MYLHKLQYEYKNTHTEPLTAYSVKLQKEVKSNPKTAKL